MAFPFFPNERIVFAVGFAIVSALGVARRSGPVANIGVFGALLLVSLRIPRLQSYWPVPLALAVSTYAAACRLVPPLALGMSFLRRGRLDRAAVAGIIASSALAAVALAAWFALFRPDYSAVRATLFPALPWPLLMVGVAAFSVVNGALEEFVYRGVLLEALDAALGASMASVLLQSLAFGALHIHGFPSGATGVALATIYGFIIGLVRRRSDGMLAPWLAHICADIAIGSILVATR